MFDFINSSTSICTTLHFTTLLHLLACWATCDGRKLAQQLISLAAGYRTGISSRPVTESYSLRHVYLVWVYYFCLFQNSFCFKFVSEGCYNYKKTCANKDEWRQYFQMAAKNNSGKLVNQWIIPCTMIISATMYMYMQELSRL